VRCPWREACWRSLSRWWPSRWWTPWTAVGALVLLSALVVAGAATAALGQYVLERTAESVACTDRRRLSERLLRLRLPELNRTEPGELISRVTSDTTVLRQVATRSTPRRAAAGYRASMPAAAPAPAGGRPDRRRAGRTPPDQCSAQFLVAALILLAPFIGALGGGAQHVAVEESRQGRSAVAKPRRRGCCPASDQSSTWDISSS
jgi:ABC-type multidrug transport system fused ATPase/permease subunit